MPEPTLDALLRAAEIQGDGATSEAAIHSLSALRASAATARWRDAWEREAANAGGASISSLDVRIRTFPIGFSTRNFCLVGSPHM